MLIIVNGCGEWTCKPGVTPVYVTSVLIILTCLSLNPNHDKRREAALIAPPLIFRYSRFGKVTASGFCLYSQTVKIWQPNLNHH